MEEEEKAIRDRLGGLLRDAAGSAAKEKASQAAACLICAPKCWVILSKVCKTSLLSNGAFPPA
jgi:hypothetical protein